MGGSFKKLFANIRETRAYKREKAKVAFTIELNALMEKRNIKRSELARLLDVTPAYITKILRGDSNFTIEKMVDLADVLDSEVVIHLDPKEENTVDWYRVVKPVTRVVKEKRTSRVKRIATASKRRARKMPAVGFEYYHNGQDGDNGDGYATAA